MKIDQLPLTSGESLEISRRRAGLSQVVAAGLFGVSPGRYRQWEHDVRGSRAAVRPSQELTVGEWCWLMRRRAKLRLREVSELTGLGVQWVHRTEQDETKNPGTLVEWWFSRIRIMEKLNGSKGTPD